MFAKHVFRMFRFCFIKKKKKERFSKFIRLLPLPSKVSWDKLCEKLEFDLVSGLSLSKVSFSLEIICQVRVLRVRIKLLAKILLLQCSDRFCSSCNAIEIYYCHDSHRQNRFPYKIKEVFTKRPLPFELSRWKTILEINTLCQFYCYLQHL